MSRPLIGLSTYREQARWGVWDVRADLLPSQYADAVERAGAVPVLLPPQDPVAAAAVVARLDGLVISGGADVEPTRYGAEPHPRTARWREDRDAWELALLDAADARLLPVLGICRGMQVMNVMEGGTLHQHLPEVPCVWADHAQVARSPTLGHEVAFTSGSLLGQAHGGVALLNSYHHQGVDQLAPTLRATGTAPDGLIEGVEGEGLLGVQWHPEVLFERHPHALGTFTAFMTLLGTSASARG